MSTRIKVLIPSLPEPDFVALIKRDHTSPFPLADSAIRLIDLITGRFALMFFTNGVIQ